MMEMKDGIAVLEARVGKRKRQEVRLWYPLFREMKADEVDARFIHWR